MPDPTKKPTPYYDHAGITIYHGDCRDILPHLPKVDLVLTDPPYGMRKADWDMEVVPWWDWVPQVPTAAFCGVRGLFDLPRPDWIGAWVRAGSVQRNGSLGGFNNWEPIAFYRLSRLVNDVISCPNDGGKTEHPTEKPLRLILRLLGIMPPGLVLDPFMGSGTTLRAAKDLGRKAIGIEIEERYCEIAAKRLQQEVFDFGGEQ